MKNYKNKRTYCLPVILTLLSALNSPSLTHAASVKKDFLANDPYATNQIIVRLRPNTIVTQSANLRISQLAGAPLAFHRSMGNGAHIYQLSAHTPLPYVRQMAAKIARDPNVLYAEPNAKRSLARPVVSRATLAHPAASPDDPLFSLQWSLSGAAGSINAPAAWQVTTGASNIVVGIVDTGAWFGHEDLQGRLIAGADLVDGDMNPAVPNTAADPLIVYHGTYVAGIIGASTHNGRGMAGINWVSKMLVVRVTDVNGNSTVADEADGMRWAAGIPIPGFLKNPAPARVINYSNNGPGACTQTEMEAIKEVRAKGAVVVVSAGNDNSDASNAAPANCPGVISVAAIDSSANRVSSSNFGPSVSISAPGAQIVATGALRSPIKSNEYVMGVTGTSFSAPMVSGVISLMLSVNPGLSPDDIMRLLKQSAQAFPAGANCNGLCPAGMLDAGKAVALATAAPVNPVATAPQRPLRALISRSQKVSPGAHVTLKGGGRTSPGAQILSYGWQQVGGPSVTLSNTHTAMASFVAPQTAATLTFYLTVTDSLKRVAKAVTHVTVAPPGNSASPTPASATTPAPATQTPAPQLGGIFGGGPGTLLNTPTQTTPAPAAQPPAPATPTPQAGGIFGGGPGTLLNAPKQ